MAPGLRPLIGQYKYSKLPQVAGGQEVLVATDGSVKSHRGRASVVVLDDLRGKCVGVIPVDGNTDEMDLFRAELLGVLSGLLVISAMLEVEQPDEDEIKLTLWTDSQAVITAVDKMEDERPWSIQEALTKEFTLISEIRKILKRLPKGIMIKWVKVHKSRMTTREERLNDIADRLAKLQHKVVGKWKSRPRPLQLPDQIIQISFHGDVYKRGCKQQA